MHLLVTGGAGFIGSEFTRLTLRQHADDRVTVLDRFTYAGNPRNLEILQGDSRFRLVRGSITDSDLVRDLAGEVDVIVNFAAESHVDRSLEAAGDFVQTDVFGTYVLLDAARHAGHQRFLQVSTDEVYGHVPEGRSRETDVLAPRSPYAASKAGAEMLVLAYRASYGLAASITRGCNTYGHHQYPEKIVPLFITNAIDEIPLPLYGDGRAVRAYVHVEDHCSAIDTVLRRGDAGAEYNIGVDSEVDGRRVAATVLRLLDRPASLVQRVADRPGHDRRYALDSARVRALGWQPRWDFDAGMAETVQWYVANQDWWRPLKSGEFWDFYRRTYRAVAG